MDYFYSEEKEKERQARERRRYEEEQEQERLKKQASDLQLEVAFSSPLIDSEGYQRKALKAEAYLEESDNLTEISSFNEERIKATNNLLLANGYTFDDVEDLPLGIKNRIAKRYYADTSYFPLTQEVTQGIEEVYHKVHNYLSPMISGDSDFNLDAETKADGFSEEDKENFFEGINNKYDYEYTKRGLQRERALKEFYNTLGEDEHSQLFWSGIFPTLVTGGIEFMMGGRILKTLAPAKAVQATAMVGKLLQGIPSNTLRIGVEGMLFGAGQATLDKMVKYEYDLQDAATTFGLCAVTGMAFGGFRDTNNAVKSVLKKVRNGTVDLSKGIEEISVEGARHDNVVFRTKFEEWTKTGFALTKNPVSILMYSGKYSDTAKTFVNAICDMTGSQNFINAENSLYIDKEFKLVPYLNGFLNKLIKADPEIISATGKDAQHLMSESLHSQQKIPNTVPHAELLNEHIQTLKKINEGYMQERIRLRDPELIDIGKDFVTSNYVNNGGFNYIDYINAIEKNELFTKPFYVKRTWNYELIAKDKQKFIDKLTNIEIARKANELYEHEETDISNMLQKNRDLTYSQAKLNVQQNNTRLLKEFEETGRKLATEKYNTLTRQMKDVGISSGKTMERTIRGVDEAFEEYFDTPAIEAFVDTIVENMRRAKLMRVFRECNVSTADELINKIDQELRTGLSEKVYLKKKNKVKDVGKSCRVLCSIIDGSPLKEFSPDFSRALFGTQLMLYGATLGSVPFNSLCDGLITVQRFGLNKFVSAFFKGLPEVVDKGLKKYSKEEAKQIMDLLPFGLEDGAKASLAKNSPSVLYDNYGIDFRGSKYVNLGRSFSDWIYRLSGMKVMEETKNEAIKKIIFQDLRLHPERVGLSSQALEQMIEEKNFSDNVLMYMLHETRKTINRGKIEDFPMWVYEHPVMRTFFTFQQWVTSLTNNFVFPFIKGELGYKHTVETFAYLLACCSLSEYLQEVRRGKAEDLTTEEGRQNFFHKVCVRGLDEITGVFWVFLSQIRNGYKAVQKRENPITTMLERQNAILSWGGNLLCNVTRGLCDMAVLGSSGEPPKSMNKDMKRIFNSLTTNLWYKDMLVNNIWKD